MGDARKKYTKEFKLDAIRLLESGTKPGHEIERDLGIGSGQIYRWRKQFSEDGARAFPATASRAMRNWPPCAKRSRSCAKNGTF